jgi:hypothetical protein
VVNRQARSPSIGGGGAASQDVAERVRRAIYDTLAVQGRAPSVQQLQELAGLGQAEVAEAVAELAAQRHLALDQSGNVVLRACYRCRKSATVVW